MFLSYAVTVLYHTVPCNCTVPACCKACALRCSWGSACVSRLSLCPPLSHRAAWPRPPSPTPWPWVCGGGGFPRWSAASPWAIARPACCLLQRPPRAPSLRPLASALRPPRRPVPSLWVATARGRRRCPAAASQGGKYLELMLY